jgi:hypothetical protein
MNLKTDQLILTEIAKLEQKFKIANRLFIEML